MIRILIAITKPGTLRNALGGHIDGFVAKDIRPAELTTAIRTVAGYSRNPAASSCIWGSAAAARGPPALR